jgi:hypothetical protein
MDALSQPSWPSAARLGSHVVTTGGVEQLPATQSCDDAQGVSGQLGCVVPWQRRSPNLEVSQYWVEAQSPSELQPGAQRPLKQNCPEGQGFWVEHGCHTGAPPPLPPLPPLPPSVPGGGFTTTTLHEARITTRMRYFTGTAPRGGALGRRLRREAGPVFSSQSFSPQPASAFRMLRSMRLRTARIRLRSSSGVRTKRSRSRRWVSRTKSRLPFST